MSTDIDSYYVSVLRASWAVYTFDEEEVTLFPALLVGVHQLTVPQQADGFYFLKYVGN